MRSEKIDCLKGMAILAVVLYHLGYLEFGYLGVDVFLVVAGFLSSRSLCASIQEGRFTYLSFVSRRVFRVLPLLLIVSFVALAIGILTMLPDDLENLGQSVVATSLFANNILQCITTRNYWDVVNEYKPLMHTWYLGLLFQFYAVVPLIFILGKRFRGKRDLRSATIGIFTLLFLASLLLFVLGVGETRYRFYYLPWRLFEFGAGGLAALIAPNSFGNKSVASCVEWFSWGVIIVSFQPWLSIFASLRLLLVVFAATILMWLNRFAEPDGRMRLVLKPIELIGMASLSVYLWHQVVLAYMRYCVVSEITTLSLVAYFIVLGFVSWGSYAFIEKSDKLSKMTVKNLAIYSILFVCVNIPSLWIHLRSGVLYDIPELEISSKDVKPGLHKQYNHKNYAFNRMFSNDSRKKVLVIGDSYARDWINVLLESSVGPSLDISYAELSNLPDDLKERFRNSQYVFFSTMGGKSATSLPDFVMDGVATSKYNTGVGWQMAHAFLVGPKYFGKSQGLFFCRRFCKQGHAQTIVIPQWLAKRNADENQECTRSRLGFVDLIGAIGTPDGNIPAFSDDGKFISQDCRHLTHGGALFLSRKLHGRLSEIFRGS